MVRILVTGLTENIGGVETFFINYYRQMRVYDDILIDVMCYTDHPAFEKEIIKYGGRIIKIPSVRNIYKSSKAIDKYLYKHGTEYIALWCNKCDLYNIDFIKSANKYNIPHVILHSHNSYNMYCGLKKYIVTFMHLINKKKVTKYATDFWACSDYAAKWLFPKSLIDNNRICYIPNAVDARKFVYNEDKRKEIRHKLGIDDQVVFGTVAKLCYVKNPIFSIDVFYEYQKKQPNSMLIMIGTGELEDDVKKYAKSLRCKEKILFLGMRKDVPDLMQAMDCMLLPSHFEGLPVVAIEAQAAGLPIFAASDGITEQTKITELLHFLPLSDGAEKWANKIYETNLERRDTYNEIVSSGFEINVASKNLFGVFENYTHNLKDLAF